MFVSNITSSLPPHSVKPPELLSVLPLLVFRSSRMKFQICKILYLCYIFAGQAYFGINGDTVDGVHVCFDFWSVDFVAWLRFVCSFGYIILVCY